MQDMKTSVQTDNTLDINNKKRKGKGKKIYKSFHRT